VCIKQELITIVIDNLYPVYTYPVQQSCCLIYKSINYKPYHTLDNTNYKTCLLKNTLIINK